MSSVKHRDFNDEMQKAIHEARRAFRSRDLPVPTGFQFAIEDDMKIKQRAPKSCLMPDSGGAWTYYGLTLCEPRLVR